MNREKIRTQIGHLDVVSALLILLGISLVAMSPFIYLVIFGWMIMLIGIIKQFSGK